jgi:hypothetical protein
MFVSTIGGRKLYIEKSAADKERKDLNASFSPRRHGEIKISFLRDSVPPW